VRPVLTCLSVHYRTPHLSMAVVAYCGCGKKGYLSYVKRLEPQRAPLCNKEMQKALRV